MNLQRHDDVGERKGYERREQSFGYNGPMTANHHGLTRESLEQGDFGNSGYVTKHSNYYKTNETNNAGQNALYENGEADVSERKTVERRERVMSYEGLPQKQFHPKYIFGSRTSQMNRLKGTEDVADNRSPKNKYYFGDDDGTLGTSKRADREKGIRFDSDDINVSISNSYNSSENQRRSSGGLNRSISFNPRSASHDKPFSNARLSREHKFDHRGSNPHLVDSPDLESPKLITNISRSVRDVNTEDKYNAFNSNDHSGYDQHTFSHTSRTRPSFLDGLKKSSPDFSDSNVRGSKASSPARSMTPADLASPYGRSGSNNWALRAPVNSPRVYGGANSPLSDDYQETHHMSSSTPEQDESKPLIKTDTTSKFSRRTLRRPDGQPAGTVESSETTTRTKSRFKESEVMYPNGKRVESPGPFQTDLRSSGGSVVIPVRDTNNKNVRYAN